MDTLYLETNEDTALDFCLDLNNPNNVNIAIADIQPAGEDTGHGTLIDQENGDYCLLYEPDENFNGTSKWIIRICTQTDDPVCDSVVVIIEVLPVNDPPVAINDTVTTTKNYE